MLAGHKGHGKTRREVEKMGEWEVGCGLHEQESRDYLTEETFQQTPEWGAIRGCESWVHLGVCSRQSKDPVTEA